MRDTQLALRSAGPGKVVSLYCLLVACLALAQPAKAQVVRPSPGQVFSRPEVHVVVDLTPASQAEIERWRTVAQDQLGVAGNANEFLAGYSAKQRVGGHRVETWFWNPVATYQRKLTLCGRAQGYSQTGDFESWDKLWDGNIGGFVWDVVSDAFHSQVGSDDEDYNLFFKPTGPFQALAQRARSLENATGHAGEIEGEFFLPYWIDPWTFDTERGQLAYVSRNLAEICAYGPFVTDHPLGSDPALEIHPIEQLWYRNGSVLSLNTIVDYSGRFDSPDGFFRTPGSSARAPFRPWVVTPRATTFDVAFRAASPNDPLVFSVHVHRAHLVIPTARATPWDAVLLVRDASGKQRELVRVVTAESQYGDVVTTGFRDVRVFPDGSVHGYIRLGASVGGEIRLEYPNLQNPYLPPQIVVSHGGYLSLMVGKGIAGKYLASIDSLRDLRDPNTPSGIDVPSVAKNRTSPTGPPQVSLKLRSSVEGKTADVQLAPGQSRSLKGVSIRLVGYTEMGLQWYLGTHDERGRLLGGFWASPSLRRLETPIWDTVYSRIRPSTPRPTSKAGPEQLRDWRLQAKVTPIIAVRYVLHRLPN